MYNWLTIYIIISYKPLNNFLIVYNQLIKIITRATFFIMQN